MIGQSSGLCSVRQLALFDSGTVLASCYSRPRPSVGHRGPEFLTRTVHRGRPADLLSENDEMIRLPISGAITLYDILKE